MQKDERDLLEVLKFELNFLEKGGYSPSPREPRKTSFIFEDSPTCMNYDSKDNPGPCGECVLMGLVPPDQRNQTIPCRHIPLNAAGETLDSLYRSSEPQDLQEIYGQWLRSTISHIEEARSRRVPPPERPAQPAQAPPLGEPLFGKLHPKCANPSCAASFHWLAGGRFFRFRPGNVVPETKSDAATEEPPAKHFWLCEKCAGDYTLTYREGRGVIVESIWFEVPPGQTSKSFPAARH
ncbi:MAG TPA: hypothetical protein VLW54_10595 [Candidatus Acidoferrales bacterium]|nr:hypothetical protein [Candidatus Acidoferrales bacterium]